MLWSRMRIAFAGAALAVALAGCMETSGGSGIAYRSGYNFECPICGEKMSSPLHEGKYTCGSCKAPVLAHDCRHCGKRFYIAGAAVTRTGRARTKCNACGAANYVIHCKRCGRYTWSDGDSLPANCSCGAKRGWKPPDDSNIGK